MDSILVIGILLVCSRNGNRDKLCTDEALGTSATFPLIFIYFFTYLFFSCSSLQEGSPWIENKQNEKISER